MREFNVAVFVVMLPQSPNNERGFVLLNRQLRRRAAFVPSRVPTRSDDSPKDGRLGGNRIDMEELRIKVLRKGNDISLTKILGAKVQAFTDGKVFKKWDCNKLCNKNQPCR